MEHWDELYLTYNSITIHKSDLWCLPPPYYINDIIISFVYEVLNDRFKAFNDSFALLDPVVTMGLISQNTLQDITQAIFSPLKLLNKKYVFLPINDNKQDLKPGQYNHWALCLIETATGKLYYFDSKQGSVDNVVPLMERYEELSGQKLTFVNGLKEKYQYNAFDCGVFLLAFTEELMVYLSKDDFNGSLEGFSFDYFMSRSKIAQQVQMNEHRREIYKLIEKIKKEQATLRKSGTMGFTGSITSPLGYSQTIKGIKGDYHA